MQYFVLKIYPKICFKLPKNKYLYVSDIVPIGWCNDGYIPFGKLPFTGSRGAPFGISRLWLRSFSSRRHFALLFENQTWDIQTKLFKDFLNGSSLKSNQVILTKTYKMMTLCVLNHKTRHNYMLRKKKVRKW